MTPKRAALAPDAEPPVARQVPVEHTVHGDRRIDPYDWLRDRGYPEVTDPAVLDHLRAENGYLEHILGPHVATQKALFEELKARIDEDETTVPHRRGAYYYQTRYTTGEQYPVHLRRHGAPDAPEEILLDMVSLAQGRAFLDVRAVVVSHDDRTLAYSVDLDGSERYTLVFVDLATREPLADRITDTSGALVWSGDDRSVFYARLDESQRPSRIFRHRLGTPVGDDVLVYEEKDPAFWTSLGETMDRRYVVIRTADKDTAETWLLDAAYPDRAPAVVSPRRVGHDYAVEHNGDRLFIRTNDVHEGFRVVVTPDDAFGEASWQELLPADDGVYVQRMLMLADHLVLFERQDGLSHVRVVDLRAPAAPAHRVVFPDPVYRVSPLDNEELHTTTLRLSYESLVTPRTVLDYDLCARTLTVRKVQRIPSGYDPSLYASERLMAPAPDGERVPVSLVYRKDQRHAAGNDLYLYAYGAYGITLDPYFSTHRLSLLDRGFVFAIAHVRGGSELGRRWYDGGKLLQKRNTFTDTIAVAEHLVAEGYTQAGRLTVSGGSAGGMLVGAVLNLRPELFHAAVASVPFVDCLNTMLDGSLPLTPPEYSEWGNPEADAEVYAYLKSYSPYDNVAAQAFPHLLVTAGLTDPRVTYWEPAKWVARLRELKTDDRLLLLKTNMSAGHGGASGRFDALNELAEQYLFLLLVYGRL